MRKIIIPAVFSSLVLLFVNSTARAHGVHTASSVGCRAVDGFATDLRAYVIDVTTGTDSLSAATRSAWNVPSISDTTQVVFVSDTTACTQAAIAHARAEKRDTLNPPAVYLLAVGSTRYVAFNGARAGEFLVSYVLDAQFNVLESF
jgi:hypothetical protein